MTDSMIQQLGELRGIASTYVDARGDDTAVSEQSKATILEAMGYAINESDKLKAQLEETIADQLAPLPPVVVLRENEPLTLTLNVPIEDANQELSWQVKPEKGRAVKGKLTPVDGELVGVYQEGEIEIQTYKVTLDAKLPLGYHDLTLLEKGVSEPLAESRLILAPQACYKQDSLHTGEKGWGGAVQLYCVRSERNWGIGDFTDLLYVTEKLAEGGADFIGLNPIHSLYPASPESASPYSPSSREWLNVIYIDVTAIKEYAKATKAREMVESNGFQANLAGLRHKENVDYTGVTQAKLPALRAVFDFFEEKGTKTRQNQFEKFIKNGGDSLLQQATYDALHAAKMAEDSNNWGWPVWEEDLQDFSSAAVAKWSKKKKSKADIRFYAWLQFVAAEQVAAVQKLAEEKGMEIGLYRDLAVGVSEGSTEIWAKKDLYAPGVSVGAPPDILGPQGQNWGLPPMDPKKLAEAKYQPMVDLFRSNMESCGALRIDHAMALLRLWWIARGAHASEGAYVYYPVQDLLGILALESHRAKCLVIGEDLGTVPEGMDVILKSNGVHSYRIALFEQAEDGGFISPAHYPEQAMAALTTHDMPTLRGFWHCDDLALGKELGLYRDEEQLQQLYADRHDAKQQLLDSLHGHGSLPHDMSRDVNWLGMERALNYGMQVHLARGASALLCLQLEDWLEMDKPVNVPGTSDEYPNWRRKLSANVEDMFSWGHVQQLMHDLTQARKH